MTVYDPKSEENNDVVDVLDELLVEISVVLDVDELEEDEVGEGSEKVLMLVDDVVDGVGTNTELGITKDEVEEVTGFDEGMIWLTEDALVVGNVVDGVGVKLAWDGVTSSVVELVLELELELVLEVELVLGVEVVSVSVGEFEVVGGNVVKVEELDSEVSEVSVALETVVSPCRKEFPPLLTVVSV